MTILHLKERVKKNKILIGLSAQRTEIEIRFLDMASTCNTLVNNNGVGKEGRVKEMMLAIEKLVPSPIITLLKVVYGSLRAKATRSEVTW